jgi:RNA polymerase primary sigma factor
MFAAEPKTNKQGDVGVEDSLRRYLNEIGRYPLLTRAQEVQLAKRVEAGDPAARQRLVESNLRLVVAIAKTYHSSSLELLDLVQEGTLGLMRAVDRYDWRRGTKFSTYAAWWIRHGIVQALTASSHPIRLPDSVRARIADVQRTERTLTAELARRPSVSELADELDLSVEQVVEARAAALPVGSLDEPVGAERELQYADVLADPNAPDPLQTLVDETPVIDLEEKLSRLPERSRKVIELRYGIRDGVARTAESVADELGVARERVRQIELHTLRKLAAEAAPIARAA